MNKSFENIRMFEGFGAVMAMQTIYKDYVLITSMVGSIMILDNKFNEVSYIPRNDYYISSLVITNK